MKANGVASVSTAQVERVARTIGKRALAGSLRRVIHRVGASDKVSASSRCVGDAAMTLRSVSRGFTGE